VSLAGEFQALPGTGSRCGGGFGTLLSYWLVAKRNGTLLGIETGPGSSIIEFPLNGPITLVHSMTTSEGTPVVAPLLEATDGQLYGVARSGGAFGGGTIFRLRYVPNAPEVLTVSSAGARVRLAWAPTAGAASYTVKRSSTSGAETTIASGLVGTEFVDTTVARGQTYYYIVTATNSFGESTATYEVSITPGRAIPGDFDGDGKTDIFVTHQGEWRMWRGATKSWEVVNTSSKPLSELLFGEFDRVGGTDVATVLSDRWAISSGAVSSWNFLNKKFADTFKNAIAADFDGNGRTDIAFRRLGRWNVSADGQGDPRLLGLPAIGREAGLVGRFDKSSPRAMMIYNAPGILNLNHFKIWRGYGTTGDWRDWSDHDMR
jgi:hypothetical protein